MNEAEFTALVREMRKAQQGYFKTPYSQRETKQDFLKKSKQLEAQVDKELKAREMGQEKMEL